MLKFYEKNTWRAALRSWWFVGFLGLITAFLSYVVYDRYSIQQEMSMRRAEAENRVAELELRKEQIAAKVEYLESERGIEAEMRRNFDVAQPGEQVVIILDEKVGDDDIEPLDTIEPAPAPWYIFWR